MKTYQAQIKILERNAYIKKTAVKFTAETLITGQKAVSFQNLNLGLVGFSGIRLPQKPTNPKLRFWKGSAFSCLIKLSAVNFTAELLM